MRVKGRPDTTFTGRIEKVFPAGHDILPSEALGFGAGGSMATRPDPRRYQAAAERFFEVRIRPADDTSLLTGQRVVTRIRMKDKPILAQWYESARKLFQRRFRI